MKKAITPGSLTEMSAAEKKMVDPVVEAVNANIAKMFAADQSLKSFAVPVADLGIKGEISPRVRIAAIAEFVDNGWNKNSAYDADTTSIVINMKSNRGRKAKQETVTVPEDAVAATVAQVG